MMQRFFFFFLLMGFSLSGSQAQNFDIAHVYPIETNHSFINFSITYMGAAEFRGAFENHYGTIYYNPEHPDQTSVSFQIDVGSIDTNSEWRDNDLKSENWFEAETYPHIQFTSTRVKQKGTKLEVHGDLTIKATTQRIKMLLDLPSKVQQDLRGDDQVVFTGSYALSRKAFGVMGKNWSGSENGITAISDEVTIEFSLIGKQMNEDNFSNFFRRKERPHAIILTAYEENGLEAALASFERLKADPELKINPNALNLAAYMLMHKEKHEDALVLLRRNHDEFPEDPNTFDSIGECYAQIGNLEKAKYYYEKALSMDPTNMNAREILKHLINP